MGLRDDVMAIIANYNSGGIIERSFKEISEFEEVFIVDNATWDGLLLKPVRNIRNLRFLKIP